MAIACDDCLFVLREDRRLIGGKEARSKEHSLGAQRQRGRQASTIGNAAGREARTGATALATIGTSVHGRHQADVSAAFASLGNHHVDTRRDSRRASATVETMYITRAPTPCAWSTYGARSWSDHAQA